MQRAWLEIDVHALAHNISETKRIISPKTEIMAVVKANGYGHGAPVASRIFLENGATRLGVSTIEEACQLRKDGIMAPILILNHTEPEQLDAVIIHSVSQTISSLEQAVTISRRAVSLSETGVVHIKIDTGMGRLGIFPHEDSMKIIEKIISLPCLVVEGIFTHFATSDAADNTFTIEQYSRFLSVLRQLEERKISIPIKHAANSAAVINHGPTHLDMVRPGIMLYGLYPSPEMNKGKVSLRPAMTLKSRISYIKEVPSGVSLSYGRTYTTSKRQRIATLPIGYADGFNRSFSNNTSVLVHGQKCPVVGRICMDQCMLDVTGIKPDVIVGDEVVLLGKQGELEITADDWANVSGTINYEVVTTFGSRILKTYL